MQKSSEPEKKSEVKAAKEGSGIEETKVAPSGDVALTKTLVDVVNGVSVQYHLFRKGTNA